MVTKKRLFISAVIAMAAVVVISNILVQFLFGNWLTLAAFTYPIAFLVTDVANRFLGVSAARKVVFYGFITGVLCSFAASQITTSEGVPLTTFRIALASGVAFLSAQLIDIMVFNRLRSQAWWQTSFFSSLIGSCVDTILFFSLAFSAFFWFMGPIEAVSWANELVPLLGFGPLLPLWVSLAVADFFVKCVIALLALVPYRAAILRIPL